MDFSNKKYIKYKTKYIELKGGMDIPNMDIPNKVEDINYEYNGNNIKKLKESIFREKLDRVERDRLNIEEKERLDRERLFREQSAKLLAEKERLDRERLTERERLAEKEKAERERLAERLAEKAEAERLAEKAEAERLAEKAKENFIFWKKSGDEKKAKENAMKEFITALDKIDSNKNLLLEKIENVLKDDSSKNKNELLTVLQEYKKEIYNKKVAINNIKEIYKYIPSDIQEKMVFEIISR